MRLLVFEMFGAIWGGDGEVDGGFFAGRGHATDLVCARGELEVDGCMGGRATGKGAVQVPEHFLVGVTC